eukprot:9478589-Pyramimonas_sp.AAC.1
MGVGMCPGTLLRMPDLARTQPAEQQPHFGDAQVVHAEANVGRCEVDACFFHLLVGEDVFLSERPHEIAPIRCATRAAS